MRDGILEKVGFLMVFGWWVVYERNRARSMIRWILNREKRVWQSAGPKIEKWTSVLSIRSIIIPPLQGSVSVCLKYAIIISPLRGSKFGGFDAVSWGMVWTADSSDYWISLIRDGDLEKERFFMGYFYCLNHGLNRIMRFTRIRMRLVWWSLVRLRLVRLRSVRLRSPHRTTSH